jgi:hypothetical protein
MKLISTPLAFFYFRMLQAFKKIHTKTACTFLNARAFPPILPQKPLFHNLKYILFIPKIGAASRQPLY